MNKARQRKLEARARRQASLAGAEAAIKERSDIEKKKEKARKIAEYAKLRGIDIKEAIKELSELKKKRLSKESKNKDSVGSAKETIEDKE